VPSGVAFRCVERGHAQKNTYATVAKLIHDLYRPVDNSVDVPRGTRTVITT
jgi:hypothetical protein